MSHPAGPPARARRGARATDADRDRAVATLRRAHEAGRLDHDEFERRVHVALTAPTRVQVLATHAGFAALGLPERGGRLARKAHRVALGLHTTAWAGGNGAAIGIWELTGEGLFWPAVLLVPTTGLLAAHAAAGPVVRRVWRSRRVRAPR